MEVDLKYGKLLIGFQSDLIAVCLSFLNPKELSTVAIAFPSATPDVINFASQLALLSSKFTHVQLLCGETNVVLYQLIHSLNHSIDEDPQILSEVLQPWTLDNPINRLPSNIINIINTWTHIVTNTMSYSKKHSCCIRMMRAATCFGLHGFWKSGSLLLLSIHQYYQEANQNNAFDDEVLISASNFIIDRLYASTYVGSGDAKEDSDDMILACDLAERVISNEIDDNIVDNVSASSSPPVSQHDPITTVYPNKLIRRGAAFMSLGRACGLLGQHLALGKTMGDASELDPFEVFKKAENACYEALNIFSTMSSPTITSSIVPLQDGNILQSEESDDISILVQRLTAEAKAIYAEVYYCAACSSRYIGVVFLPIGPEDGSNNVLNWHQSLHALTRKSIQESQNAIDELRLIGQGETQSAATVLKDLGKAQYFSSFVFHDSVDELRNASVLSLNEALRIQVSLQGENHPLVENIKRLIND